jgi:hypothetical protein
METLLRTPDQLMALAADGRLSKPELAGFLALENRQAFLDACAGIEMRFTEECAAKKDPCLGPSCSCEGEICLQPLQHAESAYHKACAAVWLPLYRANHPTPQ